VLYGESRSPLEGALLGKTYSVLPRLPAVDILNTLNVFRKGLTLPLVSRALLDKDKGSPY